MTDRRTRAWRRAHSAKHGSHENAGVNTGWKGEKSWKLMYLRRFKLRRAQKLGKVWPRREWLNLMEDTEPVNVLFVCSRNRWRSPTGEKVWERVSGVAVRSAGTSRNARRRLTVADIRWAELILVMEEKHKARIKADFRGETRFKALYVLDIEDDYRFMDPDLVEIIRRKTEPLIRGTRFARDT
jgi:predicted protein tyrosine phosphatase